MVRWLSEGDKMNAYPWGDTLAKALMWKRGQRYIQGNDMSRHTWLTYRKKLESLEGAALRIEAEQAYAEQLAAAEARKEQAQ
jgi:hypothetical protein